MQKNSCYLCSEDKPWQDSIFFALSIIIYPSIFMGFSIFSLPTGVSLWACVCTGRNLLWLRHRAGSQEDCFWLCHHGFSVPILAKFSMTLCLNFPPCKISFASSLGCKAILIVTCSLKSLDGEPFIKYDVQIIAVASECDKNVGRLKFCIFRLDSCQAEGSIKRLNSISLWGSTYRESRAGNSDLLGYLSGFACSDTPQ